MDELIISRRDIKKLLRSLEGMRGVIKSNGVSHPLIRHNRRAKADLNQQLRGYDEAVGVVRDFCRVFGSCDEKRK